MTAREIYDVVDHPSGDTYRRLLRAVQPQAAFAVLVIQDSMDVAVSAHDLLTQLTPHLVSSERSDSWPGTRTAEPKATVFRYAMTDALVATLLRANDKSYGWMQPELPEDLAFLRCDDSEVLITIAHEYALYLKLSNDEHRQLITAEPAIARFILQRGLPTYGDNVRVSADAPANKRPGQSATVVAVGSTDDGAVEPTIEFADGSDVQILADRVERDDESREDS